MFSSFPEDWQIMWSVFLDNMPCILLFIFIIFNLKYTILQAPNLCLTTYDS